MVRNLLQVVALFVVPARADSFDWLYGVKTKVCSGSDWDNTTTTIFSRVFLPMYLAVIFGAVMVLNRLEKQGKASASSDTGGKTPNGNILKKEGTVKFAAPEPIELEAGGSTSEADGKSAPDDAEGAESRRPIVSASSTLHSSSPIQVFTEKVPTLATIGTNSDADQKNDNMQTSPSGNRLLRRSVLSTASSSVGKLRRSITKILNRPPKKRLWHLDFSRIVCVSCVVTEHSGGSTFSHHNTSFVLQWVLPYLYLTSGISSMLSSAPLYFYVGRLLIVFAVGVLANLIADIIKDRNWQGDFANTIYQMFYVLMLILMAFLTAPLRRAMKWRKKDSWEVPIMTFIFGSAAFASLCIFIGGSELIEINNASGWMASKKSLFENIPILVIDVSGMLFLSSLASLLECGNWFGWMLLAYIYIPHIFIPIPKAGFSHNVQLYVFGMVVQQWPLRWNDLLMLRIREYWLFVLTCLLLLKQPDMTGRCDLELPGTHWERFRYYAIEFVLTLAFVSGAMNTSDSLGLTPWLNKWALFAYVFHVAFHRLLPAPYGSVLTYGFIPVFFAWHYWAQLRKKRREAKKLTDPEHSKGLMDLDTE